MDRPRRKTRAKVGIFTACPERNTFAKYGARVVRVLGVARGQRCMIESVSTNGKIFRSAVKWKNLRQLQDTLF